MTRLLTSNSGGARRHRTNRLSLILVAAVALWSPAVRAEESGVPQIGATVESVIDAARHMSPSLRAAALQTSAASSRAERADALDDPVLTAQTMQVPGNRANMDQTTILFQQDIPLWGKRGLRKSAALAMLDAARGEEAATTAELTQKIEVTFASYYKATTALAINADVRRIANDMAKVAASRYGQGVGNQADGLAAQAEATRASIERVRLMREVHIAAAQLNGLLARSPDAPLAEPVSLRPLPQSVPAIDALLDRLRSANPDLLAQNARVRSAEAERDLAEKAWYPDITLGAGPQTNFGSVGYAAMVGIKIPLQRGAKESAEEEAGANLGAERARLAARSAEIESDLSQALAALSAAEEVGAARRDQLVPQLEASYKSSLAQYANGRGDLSMTLDAVHRLHDTQIDLLDTDVEGQVALAMIERLIGGRL